MLYEEILDIILNLLPMLIILFVATLSLRLSDIFINKKEINFIKEMFNLAFFVYIILLFYVVTFQDVSYGTANYVPFKEMFRYSIGSRLFYKNVVGNLVMFLPYGFFITHYLKSKKIIFVLFFATILSVTIEYTQKYIGRTFDIDDIILNVVGGIIGYIVYMIIYKIYKKVFRRSNGNI